MSSDDLELLLFELAEIVSTNLSLSDRQIKSQISPKIFNEPNWKIEGDEQSRQQELHLLQTSIYNLPWSVAILDRSMRYIMVSERWIKDYELEDAEIVGRAHYEVLPEIAQRQNIGGQDLTEEIASNIENCWQRPDGRVDWLRWQLRSWNDCEGQIGGLFVFSETITERKLLEQKIQSTESQMRAVFAGMNELVFTVELDSKTVLFLPTKFFELYDETIVNQAIAQTQVRLFDHNEAKDWQSSIRQVLQTEITANFEYSLQLASAQICFSVNISPISETAVICIARDITDRKEIEQDILFAKDELAQITLQSIGDAVIISDADGRIDYLNPVAEQLIEWRLSEARGKALTEVFQLIDESTRKAIASPSERVVRKHQAYQLATKNLLLSRNGKEYAVEGSASPIKNRQGATVGTAIVFRDVTSARRMARKISWQAAHDSLTKLYNRQKFEEYVARAIQDAHNKGSYHALCLLDLDRFKIVNDTCGHAAGDKLLRQIAKLLQKRIRNSDVFARVGGDEFGILFSHCPIDMAHNIANLLRRSIEDFRFVWEDKIFRIGVSIGLVEIKSTTPDLASLLGSADAACYAAKQRGGNHVHLYHEADLVVARQRGERQWIEKLNRALEENRFRLYVQKIVAIEPEATETFSQIAESKSYQSCHYEVLLRLLDESGKLIAPGVFLPAAERYGLMPAIDRWVISTFFAGYEAYRQTKAELGSNIYAINLSGASINSEGFGDFLQEQFARYQVPPSTICFEITETVAITNLDNAIALIAQLKEWGCSTALDDFGSGMSSLTYLKNLPIDYLKIDGSFVSNIAHDKIDYATVECFNHISQIMNIKTIAEYVENRAILHNLKQIGVDYAQGYGIEQPQPLIWF